MYQQSLHALRMDFLIAARDAARHGRRTVAGAVAVTFGAAALIVAAGFIEWIYIQMREGTIHSGLGHIQIVRQGYLERGVSDPFSYLLAEDLPERKLVDTAAHVVSVAPQLRFTGLIGLGDASLSFRGTGLDPDREVGGQYAIITEQGAPLANADPAGVLLGRGLADNVGAKVGDTVVLLINKRSGNLDGLDAKVRGIFSTQSKAYDDLAVHLPFTLANEMLQARGAHAWIVYLDDTRNTPAVLATLTQQLGRDFELIPWYEAADFYNKTVRLFSRQVLVMKLIIALVVIFSISNAMMMNVLERTSEIATAMALGVRRARVLFRFLLEGVFVGLSGGLAGLALGYALAEVISAIGIPMPPPPGMARAFVGEIMVTPRLVADALLLAATTALVASLYPAWKASRLVIAEALRQGR